MGAESIFNKTGKPKTHNIVIQAETLTKFQDGMNEINDKYNVFATQTHVTKIGGNILYTAVFFVRI